jgi:hypothetical protein
VDFSTIVSARAREDTVRCGRRVALVAVSVSDVDVKRLGGGARENTLLRATNRETCTPAAIISTMECEPNGNLAHVMTQLVVLFNGYF